MQQIESDSAEGQIEQSRPQIASDSMKGDRRQIGNCKVYKRPNALKHKKRSLTSRALAEEQGEHSKIQRETQLLQLTSQITVPA